jgi:hypothetical protein
VYKSFRVDDAGGVENLKLDPGEQADVRLILRNAGTQVGPVTGKLVSRSPFLEVLDEYGSFAAAGEGETTASNADWFRVSAAPDAPVERPCYCDLVLSGPGYEDTLVVPLVVGDSVNVPAGPDLYGYRIYDYTDSCYAARPDYEWVELRGLGTQLPLGDDQTVVLDLPPSFGTWRYYGRDYTRFSVCSNGFIAADSTDRCDFRDVQLPYAGAPPNIVAVLWDNLDPTRGGAVWYRFDSAGHRLIVEFDSVPYFAVSGQWEKAEVIVYDRTVPTPTGDNSIVVQYHDLNYPQALSVGLQNADGSAGLCHTWNDWYPRVSAPLKLRTALRFEPIALTGIQEPEAERGLPARLLVRPNPCGGTALVNAPAGPVAVFASDGRRVAELSGAGRPRRWETRQLKAGLYFLRTQDGSSTRVVVVH